MINAWQKRRKINAWQWKKGEKKSSFGNFWSDLFSKTFRPSIPTDVVFIYRSDAADKVIHQTESEVRVNC